MTLLTFILSPLPAVEYLFSGRHLCKVHHATTAATITATTTKTVSAPRFDDNIFSLMQHTKFVSLNFSPYDKMSLYFSVISHLFLLLHKTNIQAMPDFVANRAIM